MNNDMFRRDFAEVAKDFGQKCIYKSVNGQATVYAIVSDEQSSSGGYMLVDGKTVSATAQFDASLLRLPVKVGDTLIVGRTSYRVSNVTKSFGDPMVTVSLSVEGKR